MAVSLRTQCMGGAGFCCMWTDVCDNMTLSSNQIDWPERMFHMLDTIAAKQQQIDLKVEEIRVKQAEQTQIAVRLDYVEKGVGNLSNRVADLEVEVRSMNMGLRELDTKYSSHAQYQERDMGEMKAETKDLQRQMIDFIKTWGPWIGLMILFAKDFIQNLP